MQARKQQRAKTYGWRSRLAAILTAPVILLCMGGHILPGFEALITAALGQKVNWVVQCIFASAVLLGPGLDFYSRRFPALRRVAPDMSSLVALGNAFGSHRCKGQRVAGYAQYTIGSDLCLLRL